MPLKENLHKNHINWVLVRWIGSCPHLHKPGRGDIDGIAAATDDDDDDGEEDENDDVNMLFTYLHLPQWFWGQICWSYPHVPVEIMIMMTMVGDDNLKLRQTNLPHIDENDVQAFLSE